MSIYSTSRDQYNEPEQFEIVLFKAMCKCSEKITEHRAKDIDLIRVSYQSFSRSSWMNDRCTCILKCFFRLLSNIGRHENVSINENISLRHGLAMNFSCMQLK